MDFNKEYSEKFDDVRKEQNQGKLSQIWLCGG